MAITDLMTRINRLFEGLMGCSLEFQPANMLSRDQWNEEDLQLLHGDFANMPRYVEGATAGNYGFPLNLHGAFAGLAVVKGSPELKPRKVLLLAELLTLAMEAGLKYEERKERLRLIEERLRLIDETSNIIPLRPARYGRVLQIIEPVDVPEPQPSPVTSLPLLIETSPGFPLNRIAIEIHHLSRRWAFISMDDLPAEIFDSRESLEQLGSITLFIRDLALLTTHQQLRLAEYLASEPTGDVPHIIAGISTSPQELEESRRVLPHLLTSFKHANLQWTEKTPEQVTSELINASLRHILEQTRETHQMGSRFIPFHIQYFDNDKSPLH